MSKNEELIETNIDNLHNNFKSKNLCYQQFIDFFGKISELYKNFSDNIDQFFSKHISIIENQPLSLHPLLLKTESLIKAQAKEFKNFSVSIDVKIIEQYNLLMNTNEELESKAHKELKDFYKSLKTVKTKLFFSI